MTDVQPIPVYRPTFLTDGGEFRGSLIESPANIFYQKVNASRATLNRLQFQWRSVSANLLLSPTVMLRMRLKITCPQIWTQLMSYVSVHGVAQTKRAGLTNANVYTNAAGGADGEASPGLVPCLVFADGDAFSSCCSSMNLIYNGTSISLNRCNRFWRDWLRTQVACSDAARIYKSAGGSYDKYDQIPVVVAEAAAGGAGFDVRAVGITQDSGISSRSKALYSQSTDGKVSASAAAAGFASAQIAREIQISFPVPLPPFNPWRGHALPASCPYKSCPLSIPHLSSGGLDFLLEDFETGFLRRLGTVTAGGGINDNIAVNTNIRPVHMEIVQDQTYIELKYFRLSHTRTLKESYRFAIWQAQTFLGEAPPSAAAPDKGFAEYRVGPAADKTFYAMTPIGKDHVTATTADISTISSDKANKECIQFDTLLISCPKLGDSYSMEADGGGDAASSCVPNCVRNLSRNLYIKQIRIIVNSARGAIEKSADVDTGFIDAERLWHMTRENCNSVLRGGRL